MKRLSVLTALFLILFLACNKDEFPDEFSIIGPWLENTTNASKIEIEFRTGNMVYLKSGSSEPIDTLRYRLEKKDELRLFLPEDYPDGKRTTHQLGYSQKNEELSIYNLFPSVPDSPSKTVFKRK